MRRAYGRSLAKVFIHILCWGVLSCTTPQEQAVEELTADDNKISESSTEDQSADPELPNPEEALADATKDAAPQEDNADSVSTATIEALAAEQQLTSPQLGTPSPAENHAAMETTSAQALTLPSQQEKESVAPSLPEVSPLPSETPATKNLISGDDQNKTYLIQSGDTLSTIALAIYGRKSRWKELAELNGIGSDGRIYAGRTLRFVSDAESTNFESQWQALAKNTMEVKRGDSLSALALQLLGNSQKWPILWSFNRENISNPNKIRVGQSLKYATKEELTTFFENAKKLQQAH